MRITQLSAMLACIQAADPNAEVAYDHEFGINVDCAKLEAASHLFLVTHGLKYNEALRLYFFEELKRGRRR